MTHSKSIFPILAELIVQGGLPLRAVAIAGQIIAIDAQINDYPIEPRKSRSLREIQQDAEDYEALLKKVESVSKEFLETKDRRALTQNLASIKKTIFAFVEMSV